MTGVVVMNVYNIVCGGNCEFYSRLCTVAKIYSFFCFKDEMRSLKMT